MSVSPNELAGLPVGGPASLAAAKLQLAIAADDDRDDARLEPIVAAVNAMVRSWPTAAQAVGLEAWPANTALGSSMLAARLYRRRNSPAGVESFGQLGAAYVMRNDPDVGMLLGIGSYQSPQLG